MNLQTAIVEDSKPDAERLKQLLKKAFENENIEMLDGTHLPVRQKDKNSLLAQFTQYQFRGMQREF